MSGEESSSRTPDLPQEPERARPLQRDQSLYRRPDTASHSSADSDIANHLVNMSINNDTPVETHLFNNISKGNSLLKIDILTGAENFCEWEITVE